jgi:hypothetical protein
MGRTPHPSLNANACLGRQRCDILSQSELIPLQLPFQSPKLVLTLRALSTQGWSGGTVLT